MTTPRRRREWFDTFVTETTGPAQSDEKILVDVGEENKGKTLVRLIIDLSIQANVAVPSSTERIQMGLGIGVVSADLPAGSVNVLVESDIPMSGWLWRTRFTITELTNFSGIMRIHADLRAQRKLMYGEPRLFIGGSLDQGDGFNAQTLGIIRALYLLP